MKPIFLLGEAQGTNEAKINAGFVGASGIELLRMLDESGIITFTAEDRDYLFRFYRNGDPNLIDCIWKLHPEVYRSNVFQQHPPGDKVEWFCGPKKEGLDGYPALIKGKYVRQEFAHELERLGDEILMVDPNLIICLGNSALWAMAGATGISKLRGTTCVSSHTVSGYKCLGTYHPAAVIRQWEIRPTVVIDLMKAKRQAEFPEVIRPPREIWIEPSLEDMQRFYDEHISRCELLSIDIETAGRSITCIGFAPSTRTSLVVPFLDTRRKDGNYWPTATDERQAWAFVRRVCESRISKLFQNGMYDIAFLWQSYGIRCFNATHDTMLASHAQQPEALKGLGFLGSIFTDEGPWKTQRKKTETIKRDE